MATTNDDIGDVASTSQGQSSSPTVEILEPILKRHTACNECRQRKLKCSGEASGCSRCVKQSLVCHYSIQKRMGRPPKKHMREDYDGVSAPSTGEMDEHEVPDPDILTTGLDLAATSEANSIFPPFYCATVAKMRHIFPHLQPKVDSVNNGQPSEPSSNCLFPIPATESPWPDFSMVSASSSCLPKTSPGIPPYSLSFPNAKPAAQSGESAECACLSYLYLFLSNLSTLSLFPITQHTICSLYIAARTARDVLRCEACPANPVKGMQNVMLTGTLLNVIADSWVRVSKANALELGQQTAWPQYVSLINSTPDPMKSWKEWLRQVVRRAAIGGPIDQSANIQCSNSPDLLSVIKEMEARQRKWHSGPGSHPSARLQDGHQHWLDSPSRASGHHSSVNDPQTEKQERDEQDFLCFRVAGSARVVLSQLNFQPHEYPGGVIS